jgi:hypothetical protein
VRRPRALPPRFIGRLVHRLDRFTPVDGSLSYFTNLASARRVHKVEQFLNLPALMWIKNRTSFLTGMAQVLLVVSLGRVGYWLSHREWVTGGKRFFKSFIEKLVLVLLVRLQRLRFFRA